MQTTNTPKWRNAVILSLVLITMIAAFTASLSFISPPAPDDDHPFDTDSAMASLTRILGDERPHPIDSDANDAVRERLLGEIRALGFTPIVREEFHCTDTYGGICARIRNVMFWAVPPRDDTVKGVALMSHYDSVPAGPGAADDGAGVAIGLEVSRLLKGRDLPRPVLVLITDGEEIGLLGAESFVQSDPLADRIDAVVNVEARGVTGPVSMFQTSRPNARDIAAIAKGGRTPLTNTLSTDIYEAMPNDTDLSRFLDADAPRQVDATNYAFILGDSFYHTPGDNLANLDRGSLFHAGANALASVEHFATRGEANGAEGQRLYFDLLTRGVLSVPAWMGIVAILLGGVLPLFALLRTGSWRGWRGWALMPLALVGTGLAAFGSAALIGLLRDSGAYAPAHPWALRGAVAAVAVFTATVVTLWLRRGPESRTSLLLKSWVWVSVIGGIGLVLFAGTATIFAAALFIAALGGVAALAKRDDVLVGLSLAAAFVFVGINLPLPGFAMAALGSDAAVFAILWAIPTVMVVAAFKEGQPIERARATFPLIGSGLAALGLIVAASVVPHYAAHAPRGLSVQHIQTDAGNFVQLIGRGTPPEFLSDSGSFVHDDPLDSRLPRYTRSRWTRSAPKAPQIDGTVSVMSDDVRDGTRRLVLQIDAPTADRLQIAPASRDQLWTSVKINGVSLPATRWGPTLAGRSARDARIEITLPDGEPIGELAILRYGIDRELANLPNVRPDWVMPRQDGDVSVRILNLDGER